MELVIIRGLPGSGKSTLAQVWVEKGFEHYEADQYFLDEEDVYHYRSDEVKLAHEWCYNMVWATMNQKRPVVVSNTFTRHWEYEKYVTLAKEKGYNVTILITNGNFDSVHDVPMDVITAMRERFEF